MRIADVHLDSRPLPLPYTDRDGLVDERRRPDVGADEPVPRDVDGELRRQPAARRLWKAQMARNGHRFAILVSGQELPH